jgi:hypothetical protein
MRERYVRPPLVAPEPREQRVAARPVTWTLTLLAVVAVVVLALVVAGRLGGSDEDPGIDRSPSPTATR